MRFLPIVSLAAISMVFACSKEDEQGDSPVQKGGITGSVSLEDEFGNPMPASSGMKVSVGSGVFGESDSSGLFLIEDLDEGVYTLTYEKPGYGTFRKYNIPVNPQTGDGITELTGTDVLGQVSTTLVTNLAVSLNTADSTLSISCNIGPNPSSAQPRSFRLFFGNSASVSGSDYVFTPTVSWSSTTVSGAVLGFQRSNLYNAGFVKGSTAWVVAYGESANSNSYTDPSDGRKVYPNLNVSAPSNVVSFIVP